jgi:hypothetical protein
VNVPDVSYARSGAVSIAYQVVGDGPTDLVFLPFRLDVRVGVHAGECELQEEKVAGIAVSVELKSVPGEWRLHAVNAA